MTLRPSIPCSTTCSTIAILSLLALSLGRGEDEKRPPAGELSALEKKFAETLSGATLRGRWCLVKGDKLGEEKEEQYAIRSATKVAGDVWLIGARIQYGGKDVTLPVPVKVFWAGDTPVISVTDLGLPGLGSYTARVMVYQGLYSGTWFGPGHSGLLSGSIVKTKEEPEGKKEGKAPEKDGACSGPLNGS